MLADLVAAKPDSAASVLIIAMYQSYEESTLGDVATLVATATKAAPDQAPAIAATVARTFRNQSDPALAAAIATIVTLVPEQSREIGLVVGAVIGHDVEALGMVAQTVAIAVGKETFCPTASPTSSSASSPARSSTISFRTCRGKISARHRKSSNHSAWSGPSLTMKPASSGPTRRSFSTCMR